MALRAAILLSFDREKTKEIFHLVKTSYDLRSVIVHGGTIKNALNVNGESIAFEELVVRVEDTLRLTIIELLKCDPSYDYEKIISNLDDRIVSGS